MENHWRSEQSSEGLKLILETTWKVDLAEVWLEFSTIGPWAFATQLQSTCPVNPPFSFVHPTLWHITLSVSEALILFKDALNYRLLKIGGKILQI